MKITLSLLTAIAITASSSHAAIIISQYVETDSGTTPKGIELWNTGTEEIDFSISNLVVNKGTNGGALSADFTLNIGTIAANEVIVIGTSDMGTYMDTTFGDGTAGSSSVQYYEEGFTFNGDDSLSVVVGGVTQDVFGTPETDPGSAWSGSGVSTQNSNIALASGITTGDLDGWTDPSERFTTVNTAPSETGGLEGFGVIPEPSAAVLGAFGLLALLRRRR